jgi:aconitate hydratase
MARTVAHKIIEDHLVEGRFEPGAEIGLRIDQTLTQDITGTMAWLEFEAIGADRICSELAVSYVDHNLFQGGFEASDDHRFLQSAAARFGAYFSRPGNGICHQVHLERFGVVARTLLGSDSHTCTAGALAMIGIGAGGLDVAAAMAGAPFYLKAPRVVEVRLGGRLGPWVSGKDVIFELLRRLTVRGGVGCLFEYAGPGVASLDIYERAAIANMGAELGATTSIFPSDEQTRAFLAAQQREDAWQPLSADAGAAYDETIEIDLGALEPLIACPHSPDNVKRVSEIEGVKVNQVAIGSCTNSSLADMLTVAAMLRGKVTHPEVSLVVAPGSKQVLEEMARNGALADLIEGGARILEAGCGPCIGMGQAPPSGGVSVRSFNRNFAGRAGTPDAQVYLASPAVCAAAALFGEIRHPAALGAPPRITMPERMHIDDSSIVPPLPPEKAKAVPLVRGPNIKPLPRRGPLADSISGPITFVAGDNITTDDIMPAGPHTLPLRSNIPAIAEHVFGRLDPTLASRLKEQGGFIIGGENYGQGSSREHAALAPMFLGLKAVLAKSFARIHMANLVNFGILPLTFADAKDYDRLSAGDVIEISGLRQQLESGGEIAVKNLTKGFEFRARHNLTPRQAKVLLSGGLLNFLRPVQE